MFVTTGGKKLSNSTATPTDRTLCAQRRRNKMNYNEI